MLMCQEGGFCERQGTTEAIAFLHGFVARINAKSRVEDKVKGAGAGSGMLTQWVQEFDKSVSIMLSNNRNTLQAILSMGKKEKGRRQNALMIVNVYMPSGYTEQACKIREETLQLLTHILEENRIREFAERNELEELSFPEVLTSGPLEQALLLSTEWPRPENDPS